MRYVLTIFALLMCCAVSFAADGGIWGNAATDQDRCQAEANYMAKHNIFRHVGPCIGRFEGIGRGYSPKCGTCTPRYRMTLTGDATAKCPNGMWIRVRSWR